MTLSPDRPIFPPQPVYKDFIPGIANDPDSDYDSTVQPSTTQPVFIDSGAPEFPLDWSQTDRDDGLLD